jgi:hypothetical protein
MVKSDNEIGKFFLLRYGMSQADSANVNSIGQFGKILVTVIGFAQRHYQRPLNQALYYESLGRIFGKNLWDKSLGQIFGTNLWVKSLIF